MSEEMEFMPRAKILTLEELEMIARAFVELGVGKVRFTGGEPLVRNNVLNLFEKVGQLPGLREMVLTTNGSQLARMAADLKKAGVRRINISLDSLDEAKFKRITRTGQLQQVLHGIETALQVGFEKLKLNTVILKNRNHDEVLDLVDYASSRGMDISFIEEMPLGMVSEHDRAEAYYSSDQIRADIEQKYELISTTDNTGGPARYFRITETGTRVGFISPHSHNFCETCNRVRLTVEGRLLLCLGQEHSVDLREVIRSHPGDMEKLKQAIRDSMAIKPKGHEFNLQEKPIIFRHMSVTGG
jgi:cyclic pyranopterin phosphate synthase